jgi:hypothetical protein
MPIITLFIAGAFAAAEPGARKRFRGEETKLQVSVKWFRVISDACFGGFPQSHRYT